MLLPLHARRMGLEICFVFGHILVRDWRRFGRTAKAREIGH
jgi:hypothetical protein